MNFFNKLKNVRLNFFSKSTALQNSSSGERNTNKEDALPDMSASPAETLTAYNHDKQKSE